MTEYLKGLQTEMTLRQLLLVKLNSSSNHFVIRALFVLTLKTYSTRVLNLQKLR